MAAKYRLQLNVPKNPKGIAGDIRISINGSTNNIENVSIGRSEDTSIIEQNPILIEFEGEAVGEVLSLEVDYFSLIKKDSFWLESIELLALSSRQHSYFQFDQFVISGESSLSGKNKRSRYGKFEIFKGKNKEFYFHLKAANGEIIAASEGYPSLQSARKGIASIKYNAEESPVIESVR